MEQYDWTLQVDLREVLGRPVSEYASADFVRIGFDDSVAKAASAMMKGGATEAVVFGRDGLIGIITERGILYKVVAGGLDSSLTKVGSIMSAPVAIVESDAKVSEAVAKMSKLGVRRLGVTKAGRFIGLVTQKNLASGRLLTHVALPELAEPGCLGCPYCGESANDRESLSLHIDRVHIGLGLLEGDLSKL